MGGRDGHIYTMNADGSDLQQLTTADGVDFDPSFAPDGRSVVFRTNRGNFATDRSGTGTEGIFIVSTLPLAERQLFPRSVRDNGGLFPDWAPDGKRVALATVLDGKHEQMVIVDAADGRQIKAFATSGECIEWSPDGKQLTFCAHAPNSGNWDVYVIDAGRDRRTPPDLLDPRSRLWRDLVTGRRRAAGPVVSRRDALGHLDRVR